LNPDYDWDTAWSQEPVGKQATRVIEILYSESVYESSSYESEMSGTLYHATSFAFMYYFLSCVLVNNGEAVGKDESLMGKVLKLIAGHAKIRHSESRPVCTINLSDFKSYKLKKTQKNN
jgi:hypothetical protein